MSPSVQRRVPLNLKGVAGVMHGERYESVSLSRRALSKFLNKA